MEEILKGDIWRKSLREEVEKILGVEMEEIPGVEMDEILGVEMDEILAIETFWGEMVVIFDGER